MFLGACIYPPDHMDRSNMLSWTCNSTVTSFVSYHKRLSRVKTLDAAMPYVVRKAENYVICSSEKISRKTENIRLMTVIRGLLWLIFSLWKDY